MLNKKTAFITGVTGQDGSHLAELLLDKGYRVVGMKRRTSLISTDRLDHIYDHPNFKMEYGNMTDSSSLYRLLKEHDPDEIYNIAAMSHVRVSFEVPEESLDVVGMGTLRLLNAYKEICPGAKFYQASSSEMYGDNPEVPQNELTRMTPASPYACAKLYAHNITRNYRIGYGLHASCGILFNHEGPRRGETFVTRKITLGAAKILLGIEDKLYLGNLDAKRDWGYAGDYVEAMWLMLQQDKPDDYVIATGETHTVREFLEEVFDYAGLSVEKHLRIDQRLFRPHEVPTLLGDPTKAKTVLGWQPKVNFKELARKMFRADLEYVKQTAPLLLKL
jgi:GDPmannose 4,6-dehydratase